MWSWENNFEPLERHLNGETLENILGDFNYAVNKHHIKEPEVIRREIEKKRRARLCGAGCGLTKSEYKVYQKMGSVKFSCKIKPYLDFKMQNAESIKNTFEITDFMRKYVLMI